jgi:hypothetical protein
MHDDLMHDDLMQLPGRKAREPQLAAVRRRAPRRPMDG